MSSVYQETLLNHIRAFLQQSESVTRRLEHLDVSKLEEALEWVDLEGKLTSVRHVLYSLENDITRATLMAEETKERRSKRRGEYSVKVGGKVNE